VRFPKESPTDGLIALRILRRVYDQGSKPVSIPKKVRDLIFKHFRDSMKLREVTKGLTTIEPVQSAINTALVTGKNLQSAILSECVYTFDIASMLGLSVYVECDGDFKSLPNALASQLRARKMIPRFAYVNGARTEFLVQAGGPNAVDACYYSVETSELLWIEYKEPEAKFGEADLLYDDSGLLIKSTVFLRKHSHFVPMLDEAMMNDFNIFDYSAMEKNYNIFSKKTVSDAIVNYFREPINTIVFTEDQDSNLIAFLANDAPRFASKIQGEIRSAGRNPKRIFTLNHFKETFGKLGGTVSPSGECRIPNSKLDFRFSRGGVKGTITGIKISSLYFVRLSDLSPSDGEYLFNLKNVYQLKSSIASKGYYKDLRFDDVKDFYLS
jgi:hypothetical protein